MASRLFAAAAFSPLPLARRITSPRLPGPQGRCWYSDKVNLWEDPMNPKRWKVDHFVVATWTVWGVLVFGGFKIFGGEEKKNKD